MSLKYLNDILELLAEDITQSQVIDRRYGGKFNWRKSSEVSADELGRGSFSRVTADSDPHLVNKQSIRPSNDDNQDGFAAFIRYLKQTGNSDNIHFPKVYAAKSMTDKAATTRHNFQMERLLEPKRLSSEELNRLCDANFTDRLMERTYEEMAFAMERAVVADSALEKYIASESLAEALRIVRQCAAETKHAIDLNEENWMVRRTSTGLQIVITDPLGYPKSHFEK